METDAARRATQPRVTALQPASSRTASHATANMDVLVRSTTHLARLDISTTFLDISTVGAIYFHVYVYSVNVSPHIYNTGIAFFKRDTLTITPIIDCVHEILKQYSPV